jgi:hypothetical protein
MVAFDGLASAEVETMVTHFNGLARYHLCPGGDTNQTPPKYKSEASPPESSCSVIIRKVVVLYNASLYSST